MKPIYSVTNCVENYSLFFVLFCIVQNMVSLKKSLNDQPKQLNMESNYEINRLNEEMNQIKLLNMEEREKLTIERRKSSENILLYENEKIKCIHSQDELKLIKDNYDKIKKEMKILETDLSEKSIQLKMYQQENSKGTTKGTKGGRVPPR